MFLDLQLDLMETSSAEEQLVRVNQADDHLIPVRQCITGIFFI